MSIFSKTIKEFIEVTPAFYCNDYCSATHKKNCTLQCNMCKNIVEYRRQKTQSLIKNKIK